MTLAISILVIIAITVAIRARMEWFFSGWLSDSELLAI
jgi:hypothetical protein